MKISFKIQKYKMKIVFTESLLNSRDHWKWCLSEILTISEYATDFLLKSAVCVLRVHRRRRRWARKQNHARNVKRHSLGGISTKRFLADWRGTPTVFRKVTSALSRDIRATAPIKINLFSLFLSARLREKHIAGFLATINSVLAAPDRHADLARLAW